MICARCNMPIKAKGLDRCFCILETSKGMSLNIPLREYLLKSRVSYIPAVECSEDLPIDPEGTLPIGCWVKSEAQFYYSTTGDTWIAQAYVFPEDLGFSLRPDLVTAPESNHVFTKQDLEDMKQKILSQPLWAPPVYWPWED